MASFCAAFGLAPCLSHRTTALPRATVASRPSLVLPCPRRRRGIRVLSEKARVHATSVNVAGVASVDQREEETQPAQQSTAPPSTASTPTAPSPELPPDITLRTPSAPSELESAAWLRAEAYYEDHTFSRYVESFKKQFMQQELESLKGRVASAPDGFPECVCFLAIESDLEGESEETVIGTLDIRPPAGVAGRTNRQRNMRFLNGVPVGDPDGSYVLNVCISEAHRGKGIGKALMIRACAEAHELWGAQRMYTEVDTWNTAAYNLYKKLGFAPLTKDGANGPGSRQRHLLRVDLPLPAIPNPECMCGSDEQDSSDR